jgi:CO dehydrogenase/acetyl-CoA synthase epsilon subunit
MFTFQYSEEKTSNSLFESIPYNNYFSQSVKRAAKCLLLQQKVRLHKNILEKQVKLTKYWKLSIYKTGKSITY